MKIKLKFRRQKIPAKPVFLVHSEVHLILRGKGSKNFLSGWQKKGKEKIWQPSNHPQKTANLISIFIRCRFA
jgi:hypothetical protein